MTHRYFQNTVHRDSHVSHLIWKQLKVSLPITFVDWVLISKFIHLFLSLCRWHILLCEASLVMSISPFQRDQIVSKLLVFSQSIYSLSLRLFCLRDPETPIHLCLWSSWPTEQVSLGTQSSLIHFIENNHRIAWPLLPSQSWTPWNRKG